MANLNVDQAFEMDDSVAKQILKNVKFDESSKGVITVSGKGDKKTLLTFEKGPKGESWTLKVNEPIDMSGFVDPDEDRTVFDKVTALALAQLCGDWYKENCPDCPDEFATPEVEDTDLDVIPEEETPAAEEPEEKPEEEFEGESEDDKSKNESYQYGTDEKKISKWLDSVAKDSGVTLNDPSAKADLVAAIEQEIIDSNSEDFDDLLNGSDAAEILEDLNEGSRAAQELGSKLAAAIMNFDDKSKNENLDECDQMVEKKTCPECGKEPCECEKKDLTEKKQKFLTCKCGNKIPVNESLNEVSCEACGKKYRRKMKECDQITEGIFDDIKFKSNINKLIKILGYDILEKNIKKDYFTCQIVLDEGIDAKLKMDIRPANQSWNPNNLEIRLYDFSPVEYGKGINLENSSSKINSRCNDIEDINIRNIAAVIYRELGEVEEKAHTNWRTLSTKKRIFGESLDECDQMVEGKSVKDIPSSFYNVAMKPENVALLSAAKEKDDASGSPHLPETRKAMIAICDDPDLKDDGAIAFLKQSCAHAPDLRFYDIYGSFICGKKMRDVK